MLLKVPYWSFKEAVSADVCDLIIKEGRALEKQPGQAGGKVDPKVRKSEIGWFSHESWVKAIMLSHITAANNQAWGFHINNAEQVQFTHYGLNEFYDAHIDAFHLEDGMRKVSAVLQLSDPKTYDGGRLQMQDTYTGKFFEPPEFETRGSIVVFPSFLLHQVTPVTKGDRYSAVAWATGPQFR
jgi:PKHD-type hydroxylase